MNKPDFISIQAMIEAWASTRSRVAAKKAQQWLIKLQNTPGSTVNPYFYAIVIDAWGRNSQPISTQNAIDVFTQMSNKYVAGEKSLRPTTAVFNALIKAYANSDDTERAEKAEVRVWSIILIFNEKILKLFHKGTFEANATSI